MREEVDDAAQAALDVGAPIQARHLQEGSPHGGCATRLARRSPRAYGAVPPAARWPAFEVLHRLVDELARHSALYPELDVWRLRSRFPGVAYALCEVRALTDDRWVAGRRDGRR